MKLGAAVSLASALALAAPVSAIAGDPGPTPGLESCDAIDPAFWDEDGRHVAAQLNLRCDIEKSTMPIVSHDARRTGAWTQRQYEDLWKRLQCTFVRSSGAECGDLWSVALTCRCERGGRERVFGQVANCAVRKGQLVCRTDCRRKGCAHGAILPALAPSDLPQRYVTAQPTLEHEPGAVTEILVRTRTGAGMYSESNEYRFARLDPAECKNVIGAPTVRRNDDPYAGCLSRLAEITGDPSVCRHLRTYEDGAHLPRCASSLARSRGDLRACFEIPRPTDPWLDLGASAEPSFSRCVVKGIQEHPSAAGCALLERTIDADMDPADRCHANLAVQEREPGWCDRIVHPRPADACLGEMASRLPDAALCDRLRDAERRRACRERAATGPWPRPMVVVSPATVHDVQRRPIAHFVGGPMVLPPGTQVIAQGRATWRDGSTSDAWLEVTFGVQRVYLERSALVDAGPGAPVRPQPQWTRLDPPRAPVAASTTRQPAGGAARERSRSSPSTAQPRSSPDPKPVFFVGDTFVDDEALSPSQSPLSCRRRLLDHLADTIEALNEQARQRRQASDSRSIAGHELRTVLVTSAECRELDPRLTYWGLFVDGHEAAWRKVDPSPALELSVVPVDDSDAALVPYLRLQLSPREASLIAGLPGRGRAGKALYQDLGQPENAVPAPSAAGTQRLVLATPRLGGIRRAFVEKRVVSWTAEETEAIAELVVDRATLVLERDVGGKKARVEVFRDEGFGKYVYSHADIRDVRLLDADFDGDVDVLLSTSNGGVTSFRSNVAVRTASPCSCDGHEPFRAARGRGWSSAAARSARRSPQPRNSTPVTASSLRWGWSWVGETGCAASSCRRRGSRS